MATFDRDAYLTCYVCVGLFVLYISYLRIGSMWEIKTIENHQEGMPL